MFGPQWAKKPGPVHWPSVHSWSDAGIFKIVLVKWVRRHNNYIIVLFVLARDTWLAGHSTSQVDILKIVLVKWRHNTYCALSWPETPGRTQQFSGRHSQMSGAPQTQFKRPNTFQFVRTWSSQHAWHIVWICWQQTAYNTYISIIY